MRKVGGVIATLMVHDQHQRTGSIHDWLGNDARDQQAHLAQRQGWRLVLELLAYPHQKMMRQHNQYHMMMPPQPAPRFVLIHTQFILADFKCQFDWPSHATHPRQLCWLNRLRRIAEVVLHHCRIVHVASNDQPLPCSRQTISRFVDPYKGNITDNWPLAAFLDCGTCPGRFRQPPQQLIDTVGCIRRRFKSLSARFATPARPGWNNQCRGSSPNQLIGRDFSKIPLVQSGYSITKGRRVAVECVSSNPAPQQKATLGDRLEQFDGNLRLGEEGQRFGQTDLLTKSSHLLAEPVLRNEQLTSHEGIPIERSIADKDTHLARTDFAKRTAVLMSDTSRVLALFGHSGFIDEEDAIVSITKRARDQALLLSENGSNRPSALSDKGLQTTNGDAQGQRDRFARFAWKAVEQALEVTMRPGVLIKAGKGGLELLNIALQGRQQGFDIGDSQVALWQWAGRCYNSTVHGLLPQSR